MFCYLPNLQSVGSYQQRSENDYKKKLGILRLSDWCHADIETFVEPIRCLSLIISSYAYHAGDAYFYQH